ncbi:efflux RND transporter periplasmic adaptor subunit [Flocculibacter collagenilyticus]|uniref:efflux RND transporter periplasmic adaptor subunit n=1 Tax=Flocculibacter collagenilyticus TaxID=2744479 RepID=UPI0018F5922B|nr:efflux RND transporter periplasmic adaptor subunit [Flocculibacter collagenilyticus]
MESQQSASQPSLRKHLSEKPYYIAIALSVLLLLWIFSGTLGAQQAPAAKQKKAPKLAKVQVAEYIAKPIQNTLTVYGKTQPDRIATLNAEVRAQVVNRLVQEGQTVKKGQPILQLALNDLEQQLASAEALLEQRKIEYKGAKRLNTEGYQQESLLAQAKANLVSAEAHISQLKLDISKTTIIAPFSGVINEFHVEQGDYASMGDPLAVIVDLTPLIVEADVTENHIQSIQLQQDASVRIASKQQEKAYAGSIRYISQLANKDTNTFKLEVALSDIEATKHLKAGVSSELILPLETTNAIKVTPALLSLDEKGNIGIKTVNHEDIVEFHPVDIVKTEADGVWLANLGDVVTVITRGQGFVRDGDKVIAVTEADEENADLTSNKE